MCDYSACGPIINIVDQLLLSMYLQNLKVLSKPLAFIVVICKNATQSYLKIRGRLADACSQAKML